MSGGSFNYLCFAVDSGVLESRRCDIEEMAKQLEEWGHHNVAQATRSVLDSLDRTDELARDLADVWKAVEWKVSCDWGMDDVVEAVSEWNTKHAQNDSNPHKVGTDEFEQWNYDHGKPGSYILVNGKAVSPRYFEVRQVVRLPQPEKKV